MMQAAEEMRAVAKDRETFMALGGRIDEEKLISDDKEEGYIRTDFQYMFMGAWALKKIVAARPALHVDIGGDISFMNYLSHLLPVEHRDIRKFMSSNSEYRFVKDDITSLHIPDDSVKSLSCLHVAEHIGLGRYGDKIDPQGFYVACHELVRVLAPKGRLYFAVPVGIPKVVFNAHRVLSTSQIIDAMRGLEIVGAGFVSSDGIYSPNYDIGEMDSDKYGCGMFELCKP